MGSWYWWMLIGMALVTYIPRAIPLTFLEGKELPPIISGVLQNIPYAILGAMIFPAILLIKEGDILFGLVGTVTAFVIAFAGANVIIVVIGAIAILSIYSFFF
ncbi:AzlD domain-containing protein [Viridibacillus sp. FSL R5-0477]|uniref:Branched-chain amino acid transport n=1 Tax=Viridibacillus arenosi FSL R5-213 TaxID=1227360 RepID=W4F637_9BACL|nr:AzlD domain-containing protein [Viridibacillus arenosi]ETT87837.1 branched-chain amino acid transport [Viridibacillus arenosi FSL R5-213]OMC89850.1 branched-chain amino acid transporter [Viridibacillus arenosi]